MDALTDRKGHTWTQTLEFEWTRSTGQRTATIQASRGGYYLTATTGQHTSAIAAIGEGAPVLEASQFETFDAAATYAALIVS